MKWLLDPLTVLFLITLGMDTALPIEPVTNSDEPSLASLCATEELLPPIRLKAGSAFIDTGSCVAHSGPQLIDLDLDGKQDLLVGDFSGHIHFYKNIGTQVAPIYAEGKMLEANGKAIEISNW